MSKSVYLSAQGGAFIGFGAGCYLYWAELSRDDVVEITNPDASPQIKALHKLRGDRDYVVLVTTVMISGVGWARDAIQAGAVALSWHDDAESAKISCRAWMSAIVKAPDQAVLGWNEESGLVE